MVHQTSNRHIHAGMNNLKFIIILDYLTPQKFGILDWRRDFCDWYASSHSIWKLMPFRYPTEYQDRPLADATDAAALGPAPLGPRAMVFG